MFPFSLVELIPDRLTPLSFNLQYSEFDWIGSLATAKSIQCSTPEVATRGYT